MPQPALRSAMLKNLRPSANSKNANTTFTVFNQLPDFRLLSTLGNMANSVNGNAKPTAKPNMEISGMRRLDSPALSSINAPPNIGPVQLKDTNTVVSAIKNGAKRPPLSASSSDLLISHDGNVISNKPKNDNAKTKNITKNTKLGIQWCLSDTSLAAQISATV